MKSFCVFALVGLVAGPAFATDAPRPANLPDGYTGAVMESAADTGPLVERLRATYSDRLAGIFEHAPDVLVVRLTGDQPVKPEAHQLGKHQVNVIFRVGAEHSYKALSDALEQNEAAISNVLPTAHGRHVDERTGEVVIAVKPGSAAGDDQRAKLEKLLGVPVRIEPEEPAVLQHKAG